MKPMHSHPARLRIIAAAGILILPLAAWAEDAPENRPAPSRPAQEAESIQAPEGAVYAEPEHIGADQPILESTQVPADASHRGATLTDAGRGAAVSYPTANERLKLDGARAAIEASRAAGTLFVTELPEDTIPATPEELAAMKAQMLAARQSAPVLPDPVAGVGEDLPSVQEIGPSVLSASELAKLRGEIPPANPILESAPVPTDAAADGASAASKEEASNE